jgi:putative ABC transport system permease protein
MASLTRTNRLLNAKDLRHVNRSVLNHRVSARKITVHLAGRPTRCTIQPVRQLWQDVKFGARTLTKSPAFAAVAVLTLALGIGATTVMFSVIDSILLHPFSYRNMESVIYFFIHDPTQSNNNGRPAYTMPEFATLLEENHVFQDIVGMACPDVLRKRDGGEGVERWNACLVTDNAFPFYGVQPLMGRWLTPEDAKPDAPPVIAMDSRKWESEFHSDPNILGKVFVLDNKPYTLVAVMPPRYTLGDGDVWIPVAVTHSDIMYQGFPLYFLTRARLKPGVSQQAAAADVDVIAKQLAKIYPKNYPKQFTITTRSFLDNSLGNIRGMLYALMAAVGMLLLIACSNVANMLLVRATVREKEMALRATLGATRGRLIGQLIVESLILSAMACAVGVALAYFGLKVVVALVPIGAGVPTNVAFGLNATAYGFAIGVAIAATMLCGLAPAIHAVRGELGGRLSGAGKGTSAGHRHGGLRAALVVVEVALSVLLLIGTGLMVRTLLAIEHVDLGFNPKNLLWAELIVPHGRYDTAEGKTAFYEQVLPRIAVLPGVVAAAETISVPPFGGAGGEVTIPGQVHSDTWESAVDMCSAGYFRVMGLPLLRGRVLTDADVESARKVAVINQMLARKYFANEDPIGQTIKFNLFDQRPDTPHDAYFEIIGVVGDTRNQGLRETPMPGAYVPYTLMGQFNTALIIRTAGDPLAMLETVRREVWAVDSNVALGQTFSIEGFLQKYFYSGAEFGFAVFGAFAGIGLVLVVIGVFSVMAYNVSLQTHEIGVRMALGAQRQDILRMILSRGAVLIAAGAAAGVATSYALARLMASQVWGVSATDPATYGGVVAVVAIVGLAACWLPARFATRVDPNSALRYE